MATNKLRHHLFFLSILVLIMLCAAAALDAEDYGNGPAALPTVIDCKRARRLILSRPMPEYPSVAKLNYLQGQVLLEIIVDRKGKVANVHVLNGNAVLAAAAVTTTRQWLYHPLATAKGPLGFVTTVTLKYSLHFRGSPMAALQAEQEFLRHVEPPKTEPRVQNVPAEGVVHMRLLVNDRGQVVDRQAPPMDRTRYEALCQTVRGWTIHPALWSGLPIASYFDVNVPIGVPPVTQAAGTPGP
jgi:TonB family protein